MAVATRQPHGARCSGICNSAAPLTGAPDCIAAAAASLWTAEGCVAGAMLLPLLPLHSFAAHPETARAQRQGPSVA